MNFVEQRIRQEGCVKSGDVLIAIDSTKITTTSSVQETVSRFSPEDKAVLTVLRDGKELKLDVTFKGTAQETGTVADDGSVAFYGSSIQAASKETLERLGLKSGVEIVELGPGKVLQGLVAKISTEPTIIEGYQEL